MRQWSWTARAAHEQAFAKATWFVTFTFRPAERQRIFVAATLAEHRGEDTTQRLVRASGSYITDYFKRLRKAGLSVRYVCVPELHRDGFPHWHGLVHSQDGQANWDKLSSAWTPGWSVVKLVRDANALRYVTKYLSKDRIGRVRASLKYGEPGPQALLDHEREARMGKGKTGKEREENGISSILQN